MLMETSKTLKSLIFITVIVLNVTLALIYLFTQINNDPKENTYTLQSKLDSIREVKFRLEKELNNYHYQAGEKKAQSNKMQQKILELKKYILKTQSQMRSLVVENEKLELKVQDLEKSQINN